MSLRSNTAPEEAAADQGGLTPLTLPDIPANHPVQHFAKVYHRMTEGMLIPDELEILEDPTVQKILPWAEHVEPIDMKGYVDFYVINQGDKISRTDSKFMREGWMGDTMPAEFVDARYHEIMAAAVLRRPMFSRGLTPTQRALRTQLRGVFPMFAKTQARLRLLVISAEPYVEIKD